MTKYLRVIHPLDERGNRDAHPVLGLVRFKTFDVVRHTAPEDQEFPRFYFYFLPLKFQIEGSLIDESNLDLIVTMVVAPFDYGGDPAIETKIILSNLVHTLPVERQLLAFVLQLPVVVIDLNQYRKFCPADVESRIQ